MNTSHKALLLASCISLTLHSMEREGQQLLEKQQQPLTSSLTALQISNVNSDIKKLYNKAEEALEKITSKDICKADRLLQIFELADSLKARGITEYQMVEYAFKKKPSLENNFFNHMHAPYNGPHYVSVFFARLKEYNDCVIKNSLINPTIEDLTIYANNRAINTTIEHAYSIGVSIKTGSLKQQDLYKEISDSIAITKFIDLVAHIYTMRRKNPTVIEEIASLKMKEIAPLLL